MAKIYFEKLSQLVSEFDIESDVPVNLEVKHFFSGAALYVNDVICASWSPAGLAFKLAESEVLIANGKAKPLKYFEKGHIKKGYAMFDNPEAVKNSEWKSYLFKAIEQIL